LKTANKTYKLHGAALAANLYIWGDCSGINCSTWFFI